MESRDPLPRILLVEDDAISQAYFTAVLEALPATIEVAATRAAALDRARALRHDLWLIDLTLPDGSGNELLAQLQRQWPHPPPALAHTADADGSVRSQALQAGFRDVLVKPLAARELVTAVRDALAEGMDLPDWDNDAAARALNGDPANVKALRELFLAELPEARREVVEGVDRGDSGAVRARLHRLQAGCGLVGASRLGAAVEHLRRSPGSRDALERFVDAARALLG